MLPFFEIDEAARTYAHAEELSPRLGIARRLQVRITLEHRVGDALPAGIYGASRLAENFSGEVDATAT